MGKKAFRVRPKIKIEKKTKIEEKEVINNSLFENITKTLSREIKFTLIMIFAIVILVIAGSYSIFTATNKSDDYNTVTVGTLKIDFLEESQDVLNLNGAYPTMDTEGEKLEPYQFKITNNGTLKASYKVRLINDDEVIEEDKCRSNLLSFSALKVKVNEESPVLLLDKYENDYTVAEGIILPNETKEYSIRIWIKDTAGNEVLGRHYHGKIVVDSVNLSTE